MQGVDDLIDFPLLGAWALGVARLTCGESTNPMDSVDSAG